MTDTQLYFTLGIPGALFALNFLAILAAAFWQAKHFDDMANRFDDMSNYFDARFNSFEKLHCARFKAQSARLRAAREGMNTLALSAGAIDTAPVLRVFLEAAQQSLKHLEDREH
jgi:hypothetical protein